MFSDATPPCEGSKPLRADRFRDVLEEHPDTEFERARACCHRNIAPPATIDG